MSSGWSEQQLAAFDAADELRIAVRRGDGTTRRAVPIWVVVADGEVYVRTWYRRETGWFGAAIRSRRASVSVSDLESDVAVDDVGSGDPTVRAAVDLAYHSEYAAYGAGSVERMIGNDAAATTLRLDRAS